MTGCSNCKRINGPTSEYPGATSVGLPSRRGGLIPEIEQLASWLSGAQWRPAVDFVAGKTAGFNHRSQSGKFLLKCRDKLSAGPVQIVGKNAARLRRPALHHRVVASERIYGDARDTARFVFLWICLHIVYPTLLCHENGIRAASFCTITSNSDPYVLDFV